MLWILILAAWLVVLPVAAIGLGAWLSHRDGGGRVSHIPHRPD